MRRIWVTVVVGGLLVCVLTGATVAARSAKEPASTADVAALVSRGAATVESREKDGLGPPPWAQAGGRPEARRGSKAAKSWKDDWRALGPAQKEQKMAALSRAHREGMRTWVRCVRDAGSDRMERRACEKPLPPGLAKKQP